MDSLELFSGAGGLAKGLELSGLKTRAFVEWNPDACATLRLNFKPSLVFEGDVRDFSFSDYSGSDIIAGGPPCQPFSLGGKAAGNNDQRDMFPAAVSAIRNVMPKAFIFENVKGLLRKSFSEYFSYILLQLKYPSIRLTSDKWEDNLGVLRRIESLSPEHPEYNVEYYLVNAADYGVPQIRERIFIIGFRSDIDADYTFPKPTHSRDALLWNMYVTGDYWRRYGLEEKNNHIDSDRIIAILQKRFGMLGPQLHPWLTVRDAIHGLGKPVESGEHALRDGAKIYPGHTGSYIDWPSKTIKAGAHGVPGGENMIKFEDGFIRYYTVAEAKRIQTFPDDYHISGSWTEAMRQLGNAVPVRLADIVAKSVVASISGVGIKRKHNVLGHAQSFKPETYPLVNRVCT